MGRNRGKRVSHFWRVHYTASLGWPRLHETLVSKTKQDPHLRGAGASRKQTLRMYPSTEHTGQGPLPPMCLSHCWGPGSGWACLCFISGPFKGMGTSIRLKCLLREDRGLARCGVSHCKGANKIKILSGDAAYGESTDLEYTGLWVQSPVLPQRERARQTERQWQHTHTQARIGYKGITHLVT